MINQNLYLPLAIFFSSLIVCISNNTADRYALYVVNPSTSASVSATGNDDDYHTLESEDRGNRAFLLDKITGKVKFVSYYGGEITLVEKLEDLGENS